ncbi:hypothetical protein [Shewanella sp. T24-MNA-CIBAN-0130]|uniref:hypothetical protein n=1 Tax=Shewanella sp. T24-MNA-CIBAN-0130 TaxID=3140470 RepID=UPI00332B48DE
MVKLLLIKVDSTVPRPMGLITVDMDIAAERIMILNRSTGQSLLHTIRPPSGISKTLVPLSYTTSNKLLVGILDDGGVYDAKFKDGIMAELVDANTVNMSQ